MTTPKARIVYLLIAVSLMMTTVAGGGLSTADASWNNNQGPNSTMVQNAAEENSTTNILYIPAVVSFYPTSSVFGFETLRPLTVDSNAASAAGAFNGSFARMNNRISWRILQPVQGAPINWALLEDLKNELKILNTARIKPVIVIDDYPHWAVIPYDNEKLTSCAALRQDSFSAYGEFIVQLSNHLKSSGLRVHFWELGNEPDVDPRDVPQNSVFGCWGDKNDPYFGGEHYGEMLKVVTPMLKASDPMAQVWIGGLLLNSPETTMQGHGKPELFFEGILRSGAGPYFDAVPYHWYPHYTTRQRVDFDLNPDNVWHGKGGGVVGKARFLRETMQRYGVSKPVFLNETAIICKDCTSEIFGDFYQAQADFAVRSFTRGLSENVQGFMWYTIEGPGWHNSGLLDGNGQQKPVYHAYKNLYQQTLNARYVQPASYGDQIEGYVFSRPSSQLEIIWTKTDNPTTISVPQSKYMAVYDLQGSLVTGTAVGDIMQIPIGFSPVFLVRQP